ncbi:MAG TPA: hypothetical protein VK846_01665 [Candidatus Limnocylindria bacterium]|nr:hypothetical protein [Candidatus Limnocylindria bacterium]
MNEWNASNQPLKVGDRVTLKQLIHAHTRCWLEQNSSIKDTAAAVGLHPGALSRKIDKEKIAWMKYPKAKAEMLPGAKAGMLKNSACRGCPPDDKRS